MFAFTSWQNCCIVFVRLDVLAQDIYDAMYDTEVQKRNTRNLPRRSRFYQGVVDGKLLEPGEIDYNKMGDVYIIMITRCV